MNKTWNKLLAFESRDLVGRYIKEKFERELNRERTLQITSNFIQGREYFRSSENANSTVRPLLQYYGVMALSKGIILCLDVKKTESQLKSSHGLEITNWNQIIKNKDFENLKIIVRDGTFYELITVTQNINYIRSNSSAVNNKSHLIKPQKGDYLILKQLISYFPDLQNEYKSWLKEDLHFAAFNIFKTDKEKNSINIELQKKIERDVIKLLFPDQYCPDLKVKWENNKTYVSYTLEKWYPNITQRWGWGPLQIGEACIIPTLKDDIGLNLISGLYMISYVFGMMARYFPTTWIGIMRGEKGDKIYPFVHRLMDFIDEKFPIIVLDFLNSPYDFENK